MGGNTALGDVYGRFLTDYKAVVVVSGCVRRFTECFAWIVAKTSCRRLYEWDRDQLLRRHAAARKCVPWLDIEEIVSPEYAEFEYASWRADAELTCDFETHAHNHEWSRLLTIIEWRAQLALHVPCGVVRFGSEEFIPESESCDEILSLHDSVKLVSYFKTE